MRGGLLACVTVLPLLLLIANVLQYFVTQQSAVSAAPIRRAKLFRAASTIVAAIPPPPPPPPPPPSPTSSQSSSSSSATIAANLCNATAHIELWGSVVLPGSDNPQPSAEACCAACRAYVPLMDIGAGAQCNTFVWHLDPPHECWLKNQQPDALARAAKSLEALRGKPPQNPKLRWVSGVVLEKKACADCEVPPSYYGCIGKDKCNTTRACGSPAIDGYAHVDPRCFDTSPTTLLYREVLSAGTRLVGYHEEAADYDGLGVHWGIGHKKGTWQACEAACFSHKPAKSGGPYSQLPCNVWTWCSRPVCFEPDAHSHSMGDCWLKFSEEPWAPEVNMRSKTSPMRPAFMQRHRKAMVDGVPWWSGALLPEGRAMTNGSWGPRAYW